MKKILLLLLFVSQVIWAQGYQYLGAYDSMGTPLYLENPGDVVGSDTMDMVGYSLPEGYPVPIYNPHYITAGYDTDLIIDSLADVWVTFVSEGAGYKNVLGFYTYDINNPPVTAPTASDITIIFPNVSALYSGGGLLAGDKVKIGTFPAGTGIGWVLLANAWNSSTSSIGNPLWAVHSNPDFNPEALPELQHHNVLLQDAENERIILGFEDVRRDYGSCDNDFNDAVFYVSANPYTALRTTNYADVSKSATVTSGNTGGLESDGKLASLVAVRNFKRSKENHQSNKKNQESFTSYISKNGGTQTTLDTYIPNTGMYGTEVAQVSTPQDLIGITNANEVLSVDYYEQSNRVAAVLATSTTGSIYDHSKVICDRLNNSSLDDVRVVTVNGYPMISSKITRANGEVEYALGFSIKHDGAQNELYSLWEIGQYPTGDYYNFQVWGSSFSQVFAITNGILSNFNQSQSVVNTTMTATVPEVFVNSGYYKNGALHLTITNKTGVLNMNFSGNLSVTEQSGRQNITQSINLSGGYQEDITIPTGGLFDIGFSINTGSSQPDTLYLADGPWGLDYLDTYATVSQFDINAGNTSVSPNVYHVERNPIVTGNVKGNINLFRHLLPGDQSLDITNYDTIQFDLSNDQDVEIVLVPNADVAWTDRYTFTIPANQGSTTTHTIRINEFENRSGVSFSYPDIKTIVFSVISDYSTTIPFSISINDLQIGQFSTLSVNQNYDAIAQVMVYPNPASTTAYFKLPVSTSSIELHIYDMNGRLINRKTESLLETENSFKYDVTSLKKGYYVYKILTANNESFMGKLVKQ